MQDFVNVILVFFLHNKCALLLTAVFAAAYLKVVLLKAVSPW